MDLKLQAPQLIWLALVTFSLGIHLAQHGEPKKGKESFWIAFAGTAITAALLYWGGFFTKQ